MTKKERIKELEKRNFEIEETIRFLLKDRETTSRVGKHVQKTWKGFRMPSKKCMKTLKHKEKLTLNKKPLIKGCWHTWMQRINEQSCLDF